MTLSAEDIQLNINVIKKFCPLIFSLSTFHLCVFADDEEMDADGVIDPGMEYIPSPNATHSTPISRKNYKSSVHVKQEIESEEEKMERLEAELHEGPSIERMRDKRRLQPIGRERSRGTQYHTISMYEEKLLLKRLEACPNAVAVTPEARRLRQKLMVRKAKRERGLPIFDLDQAVNAALSLVGGVYGAREGCVSRPLASGPDYTRTSKDTRILDRYQVSSIQVMLKVAIPITVCLLTEVYNTKGIEM